MAAMPPMTGVYNIPVEPGSPYIHHQTVRRLPSMKRFYSERSGIAERLRQVIGGYLDDGGFPTHNEILQEVFGRYAVGDYPSDRTMCFFVGDLDAFTPDFIRVLQERVLADYPLWRLKAQFEERSIGVYPQGAWLGDQWVAGPSTATHLAYRKWLIEAREYREKRFGPLRRQLAYVRRLIPAVMATASRQRFRALGVFDCYQPPHFSNHSIWILQTINPCMVDHHPDQGPVRTSAVNQDGDIYPEFCEEFEPYTDVNPPFWLVTYLLGPTHPYEFVIKDEQGAVAGRASVKKVIRDAQLLAEEGERGKR